MNYKIGLIITFLVSNAINLWAGGPWTQKKGEGYFQAGFTTKNWEGSYQGSYSDWKPIPMNRTMRESNIMFYGEYGISHRLSLITDFSYRLIRSADEINPISENSFNSVLPAGSINAFSNPMLSLKYSLNTDKINTAILARVNPNISVRDAAIGIQSDYDAATYGFGIAAGKGLKRGYWQFESTLLIRNNNYGESINGNFQYGWALRSETYLIFDLNYQIALENGTHDDGPYKQTTTFIDNQGFVAYGAKIHSKLSGNISGNIAFYSGFGIINQGNQPAGIFAGIAYELKK